MNRDSNPPKINPWLIAVAVILPTFIEMLDTTVVSVALENIAGNLSATISQATWIQTGYLISNAVVLPATAWFSALLGRKRFLMICIGIFTLASFACGEAPNLTFLIIASIVQGAGGGALQPISQAILMESFPPAKRGLAMALTTIPLMTVALATIRNEQMGNATGLFALARNLAGSIGIAVAIAMVSRGALRHQAYLTAHLTPYDLPYQNAVQMGQAALTPAMGAQAAPGTLGVIYKSVLLQSNMQGFADEFRWLALVCFLSVPLVLLLKKAQGKKAVMMH
jgi:MFS family permease